MNKDCRKSEWDIKLKAKRSPRFKAGSELADKVNIMQVDINEEENEQDNEEMISISLKLTLGVCPVANDGKVADAAAV